VLREAVHLYACPVNARSLLVIAAVAGVVALLAFGLLSKEGSGIAIGDPAPDKTLQRLGAEGEGRIADYRGSWVLVNFWASWCEPCRVEAPELEAFQREYAGDRFTILGISLGDASDSSLEFVEEFGLTYPQLRDADEEDRKEAYGMVGFPESFLVDPDGNVALIRRGVVDSEYLNRYVKPLIESPASS
jgi:peroxiredoxin